MRFGYISIPYNYKSFCLFGCLFLFFFIFFDLPLLLLSEKLFFLRSLSFSHRPSSIANGSYNRTQFNVFSWEISVIDELKCRSVLLQKQRLGDISPNNTFAQENSIENIPPDPPPCPAPSPGVPVGAVPDIILSKDIDRGRVFAFFKIEVPLDTVAAI